jgi:hypothetical protein
MFLIDPKRPAPDLSNRLIPSMRPNYGIPEDLSLTVTNPKNQQEPIFIHITNVVSPQVTSNSNAISNANSVPIGFSPSTISDQRNIPFLSGSQLIPFSGDPKSVKVAYIPVFVPVKASMDDATTLSPSLRAHPGDLQTGGTSSKLPFPAKDSFSHRDPASQSRPEMASSSANLPQSWFFPEN